MSDLFFGLAFVLVFEGLVLALAPSRLDDVLQFLKNVPLGTRKIFGLCAAILGTFLFWVLRAWAVSLSKRPF